MRKAGLHYGDRSARDVLVVPGGATRVVDAGCVVPAAERVVLREFTPDGDGDGERGERALADLAAWVGW